MSNAGAELLEELRRRRSMGDSRLTPQGRELFERLVKGDLANAFADELNEATEADRLLSGKSDSDN